jgi:hypothetical protein
MTFGNVRIDPARCGLLVTSPGAGASVLVNSTSAVAWQKEGSCSSKVRLDLMKGPSVVATLGDALSGSSYLWTPSSFGAVPGTGYYIRIVDTANESTVALSQVFTIGDGAKRRGVRH